MFNRLKKIVHRDYVVCYKSLDLFHNLWNITLKQREYAPKFYVHTDGTVWTSYMRAEVVYNGHVIIPHSGHIGVFVYDTKRFEIESEHITKAMPCVVSNVPVDKHFTIPKPVMYASSCGMLPRAKFTEALDLKFSLKRAHHDFR